MPDWSIAWDYMIEDQRPDSAIFSHATNLAETVIYMVTGEATLSKHGTRAG